MSVAAYLNVVYKKHMEDIEIKFTSKERDLILDHTFADADLTDRLRIAEIRGKHLIAKFDYHDLEDLLGFIAAEANHSKDKKLQNQLDRLYERLTKIQDKIL